MSAGVRCTDIFDGVLLNVKGAYLARCGSTSVKSRTLSENASSDENSSTASSTAPVTQTRVTSSESGTSVSETVRESVERPKESEVIPDIVLELQEKFPFALGAVCGDLAVLDRLYREAHGYEAQDEFSPFFIDLIDEFPLCDRFAHSCVMYVSSMLLIDVDEDESDLLYEKYIEAVGAIRAELPCTSGETIEKYPY